MEEVDRTPARVRRPAAVTEPAMSEPKIVNLETLPWTRWGTGEGIAVEIRDPARKVGSSQCGLRVYRLAPGDAIDAASPPSAARGDVPDPLRKRHAPPRRPRDVPVKAGDFILYPAGDEAAHTFVNSGTEPMEYVATGNRVAYEVCEYPEEGTVYVEAIDKTLRNEDVPADRAMREAWFKAGR